MLLITLCFADVPFFWDGTFFSEAALGFYEGKFSPFDCPENLDNVTFPVYSCYMALMWLIFGKSLMVSHIAMLPFLLGIFYEFYWLASRFLNERFTSFALLLLLAESTLMMQSVIMGYDIILVYLFLLALNLLAGRNKTLYPIIAAMIALYSIRGMFLAVSLFFISTWIQDQAVPRLKMALKQHFLCFALGGTWLLYHKYKTGWFLISPLHENTDEQLLSFSMMIRQGVFILWKLADNGRIILWAILLWGIILSLRKRSLPAEFKTLLMFLLIPLGINALLMVPFSNPIGHRYFMFSFPLLILTAVYIIQEIVLVKYRLGILIVIFFALISGNFILYPERFGNGWDSSLKTIPYFSLKDKMDRFIISNNIDPKSIGTQYPLIADKRFSHLTDTAFAYTNVWRGPLANYEYYLQSNVINTDIAPQVEEVKNKWKLVKEMKTGQVYLSLYKNPGY
jgi:hypothetical protein